MDGHLSYGLGQRPSGDHRRTGLSRHCWGLPWAGVLEISFSALATGISAWSWQRALVLSAFGNSKWLAAINLAPSLVVVPLLLLIGASLSLSSRVSLLLLGQAIGFAIFGVLIERKIRHSAIFRPAGGAIGDSSSHKWFFAQSVAAYGSTLTDPVSWGEFGVPRLDNFWDRHQGSNGGVICRLDGHSAPDRTSVFITAAAGQMASALDGRGDGRRYVVAYACSRAEVIRGVSGHLHHRRGLARRGMSECVTASRGVPIPLERDFPLSQSL